MQICKRIIAMLLALTLTFSCFPVQTVFATDGIEPPTDVISESLENKEDNLLNNLDDKLENKLKEVSDLQQVTPPSLDDDLDKLKNKFNENSLDNSLNIQDLQNLTQTKEVDNKLIEDELDKKTDYDNTNLQSTDNQEVDSKESELIVDEEEVKFSTLSAQSEDENINFTARFPIEDISENSNVSIKEIAPNTEDMWNIMEMYSIEAALDYLVLKIALENISDIKNVEGAITFNNPFIKALGREEVYLAQVDKNGVVSEIVGDSYINGDGLIESIEFTIENLATLERLVIITGDKPQPVGWKDYTSSHRVTPRNFGANLKPAQNGHYIGSSSDGCLTFHCYSSSGTPNMNDFALCLDSNKKYGSHNYYGEVTATSTGSGTWANLSTSLKRKLILLIAYGMDYDSGYARYSYDYDTFAAMQLIAWEWINGKRDEFYIVGAASYEGTGSQYFSTNILNISRGLRNLVANNPDNINPDATKVTLLTPSSSTYQTMIAIEEEATTYAQYGDLYVSKSASGSSLVDGWLFYLYTNYSDAVAGNNNYIDYAYTSNGDADFYDCEIGRTYYVREAPASKQSNSTSGWTLSTEVKSVYVSSTGWNFGGTVTNTYTQPKGNLSITKAISPSSLATSANLSGWVFELYSSQANANNRTNRIATATTNTSGVATFTNLTAGTTYYIREAPASEQNTGRTSWTVSSEVRSKAVVSNTTTSAGTITNTAPTGSLSITKAISPSSLATSANLSGWVFELYSSSANATNRTNRIATATTNTNGVATFSGLTHGITYYIREAPASSQDSSRANWTLSTEIKSGVVSTGATNSVGTITNSAPKGGLSVTKAITGTGTLSGWIFELYNSSSDATNRTNLVTTATSNANGIATFSNLDIGKTYYIREAPASAQTNSTTGWVIPATVLNGTISSGITTSVGTITNTSPAKISVSKAIVPSSLATTTNLSGWVFELYTSEADAKNAVNWISSKTTNSSGIAYFDNLSAGTYYVREAPANRQSKNNLAGWSLSNSVLYVNAKAGAINYTSAGTITNSGPVSLSVTKTITPSSDATSANLQNWRFEIYTTQAAASAGGTNYLSYGYTNTSGVVTFSGLTADTTYYVREAPASRQDKKTDLDKWSISSNIVSGFAPAGSTSAISLGSITNYSGGSLSVTKNISTFGNYSNDKANWRFELYETLNNANAGANWVAYGYTDANGVATFSGLTHGKTYYIKEAPASRQDKHNTSGWGLSTTVVSGQIVAGTTVSAGSVYNVAPGSLSITKTITSAGDFSADRNNWKFELYASAEDASVGTNLITYAYTNANGVATFDNLAEGAIYYIKEAPASRQDRWSITDGWIFSSEIKSGTVKAGDVVSVGTVSNIAPAEIVGAKSIFTHSANTTSRLNGWVFQVATDRNFTNIVKTVTSAADGTWETGFVLSYGTYYVREAPMSLQTRSDKNDFVIDTTPITITVNAGQSISAFKANTTYTSQNVEKGRIEIKKGISGTSISADKLKDWIFYIYADAQCTNKIDEIVTNSDGLGISKLLAPGNYWIKEASKNEQTRNDISRWTLSTEVIPVTVQAGNIALAYNDSNPTAINLYSKPIRLIKIADNVQFEGCYDQIADNDMYSLAGAQYQVIVNKQVVETITTDASGVAVSNQNYPIGTKGVLKEVVAPQGYLLDSREYPFEVDATTSGYIEVTVKDIPVFDPDVQSFKKVDAATGKPQGNLSFEGAIFRWDYYDNISWDGNPVRTWYFKTNSDGFYGYHKDYLATNYTSDELYKSTGNAYQVPLGSVKITEIVAPFGYVVFDQPFYATIEQDDETGIARWAYTPETLEYLKNENGTYVGEEAQDTTTFGSIEIIKKDAEYPNNPPEWTNFAGIEFTVYNKSANPVKIGDFDVAQPGEACAILVMNTEGKVSLENIPVGQYEIRETKGNDFYNINTEWIQTFSVENGNSFEFTCENTLKPEMAPGQIKGFKQIYSTNQNTAIAKQNGWLFEIATDINFTNVVATEVSDQFGNWETDYIFRAGTYYVREALLEDQILDDANDFVLDNTIIKVELVGGDSVVALQGNAIYTSQNIEKGCIEIKKDVFGIEATSANLKDWVVDIYSDANCTVLVESLITDENGIALSNRLIPGNYWIKEAPKSSQVRDDVDMWGLDETIVPVTVEAGAITKAYTDETATITNYYGKYIKLIKISDETDFDMSQLTDNDMYTLAGAEYQIIVDGEVVEILTTNENGVALSNSIYTIGTSGIIKEIAAPNGYLLDTQVHEFEVVANTDDYCEINVSDKPTLDSNVIQFKKIDAITGVAQGNASFEGAIFRWEYFDNIDWNGDAIATWYFITDEDGLHGYHPDYLAEGYNSDALYITKNGTYQMPLGSVKITEIKAPEGYLVFEESFYAIIEQSAMGEQAKWNFTDETLEVLKLENGMYVGAEPQDIDTFGSIEIQKADNETGTIAPGWATFEGIEFTIYNKSANPVKVGDFEIAQPNEICTIITIGADGKASLSGLPIGTYEIKETKGNDFYQVNEEWSQTFSVQNGDIFEFVCENTLKPAKISIEKLGTDGNIIAGAKFLLEWSLDGEKDWAPVQYSDELKMGYSSSVDADGCIVIDDDGIASFDNLHPVIYYRITEVETPNGYQLLKDHIMVGQLKAEDNFETSYKVINNSVFTMPKTGSIGFISMMPLFIIASFAMFCGVYVLTSNRKRRKI